MGQAQPISIYLYRMQEWFKDWFNSPYYHLLYADRDEKEAESFISRLIDHLQPATASTMLDVACGKGRHAFQLSRYGYDVTGIDLSPESIDAALTLENEHLHFFVQDMRHPCRINYFDYVFNFFTSFGYFKTLRENSATLNSISRSLKKDGVFVIDYLNEAYIIRNMEPETTREINGVSFSIRRHFNDTHILKEISISDPAKALEARFTEKVARFNCKQLTDMLSQQGLIPKEIWGDYMLSAFREEQSPRLIIKAVKEL